MAEPLNTTSPTTYTTAVLIGDPIPSANTGSPDCTPTLTEVGGLPVSAALEIQSTQGALLVPRMTTAQRNALSNSTSEVTNGMLIYNSDANSFQFYQSGAWTNLVGNSITTPGSTTDNAIVRWDGAGGNALQNSGVLIDDTNNITGALSLALGVASTTTGNLDFYNNSTEFYLRLNAGAVGSNITWTLPTADGQANAPLITNGSGVLSFATNQIVLGAASASYGQIVFNNASNSNTVTLISGDTSSSFSLTLPTSTFQPVASAATTAEYVPLSSTTAGVLGFRQSGMCYATGTLTSLEIFGLSATPVQILSAPGANQTLVLNNLVLELVAGGAAFTGNHNTYAIYGTAAGGTNIATDTAAIPQSFIQSTVNTVIETPGLMDNTVTPGQGIVNTGVSNQPISLTASGVFATGNGSLRYHAWYSIVNVT